MVEHSNKTIMCSVMFLDIVAYSKKSVSAQIAQKEVFNGILANAIQNVPVNDRVILDTGDGAAVTFLGDVEDALKAVLVFRESLLGEGASMDPPLQVCMGINLGPVRLVQDINGRPNIVGDGINVAQRIMGFAKPGQILVSRSYFDAASRLSHEYAGMFYNEGTRADKHDREHEIYAIGQPGEAGSTQQTVEDTLGLAVNKAPTVGVQGGALATFQNASAQQRALYAGIVAAALALLITVTVKITHRPEPPAPQVALDAQPAPAADPAAQETAPPATTEDLPVAPGAKNSDADAPAASLNTPESITVKKSQNFRSADAGKNVQPLTPGRPQVEASSKDEATGQEGPTASINFAIAPWGEVYVDGKKKGVSPPLDTLSVPPGAHEVEIRNTTFPPYTQSIQAKADDEIKITHKFAN